MGFIVYSMQENIHILIPNRSIITDLYWHPSVRNQRIVAIMYLAIMWI